MTYGCGSDTCLSCYPFTYRCEHGTEFPEPVPNGQPEPDCEEIGCPGDEDEGGHADGDGCAIYYSGYTVTRDGERVSVEDLMPGDVFEEDCYPGEAWQVEEVCEVGDNVHVDLQKFVADYPDGEVDYITAR